MVCKRRRYTTIAIITGATTIIIPIAGTIGGITIIIHTTTDHTIIRGITIIAIDGDGESGFRRYTTSILEASVSFESSKRI